MGASTAIEWTDMTWSPWEGCQKVGPGCDHCYAESMNRWLRRGELGAGGRSTDLQRRSLGKASALERGGSKHRPASEGLPQHLRPVRQCGTAWPT